MAMRYVILFVLGFFGIVLRDTLFNDLSIAGGKPDFILIMVVFFAIFNGPAKGGWLGLGLGLLEDLMVGRFIGVNALCKGMIGFAIGFSERRLYKNNFFVPIVCLLIGSLVNSSIYFLISKLIGSNIFFSGMVLTAVPDAIYNSCFAPMLYAVFYKIHGHEAEDDTQLATQWRVEG